MKQSNNIFLTVAVSSRALFDLDSSHKIYEKYGLSKYLDYQEKNLNKTLSPGTGFSLVNKLLKLSGKKGINIDVILVSKNSAETGLRIFNSIQKHNISISKAAFTKGNSTYPYIEALNTDLYLSFNKEEIQNCLKKGIPAALIHNNTKKITNNSQLKIAFDGDSVIFSEHGEKMFQQKGLEYFCNNEKKNADIPLKPGPFKSFVEIIHKIQTKFPEEKNPIRTALITARSAPAHKRVINTLKKWNIRIDEIFFLGGMEKGKILSAFDADIYFDDQEKNCEDAVREKIPTCQIIS